MISEPERCTGGATPTQPATRFQLAETMLCKGGIALQELHLDRLTASATYFEWPFDRVAAERLIARRIGVSTQAGPLQIQLRLSPNGDMRVRSKRFVQPKRHGRIRLASQVTPAQDIFRQHQTTCRGVYDRVLPVARREGLDDLIFSNDRGELTEGTSHRIFLKRGKKILTPPTRCGVLPGVFRRYILETDPFAEEQILHPEDVRRAEAIYLTNSLVGIFPVVLST